MEQYQTATSIDANDRESPTTVQLIALTKLLAKIAARDSFESNDALTKSFSNHSAAISTATYAQNAPTQCFDIKHDATNESS
jgi:hypothetical protein